MQAITNQADVGVPPSKAKKPGKRTGRYATISEHVRIEHVNLVLFQQKKIADVALHSSSIHLSPAIGLQAPRDK
jgi:hypothetical protein